MITSKTTILTKETGDQLTAVEFNELNTNFNLAIDDLEVLYNGSTNLYNTTLDESLITSSTIGGIPEGTTVADLKNSTYTDLFDMLLFPTSLPTYTIPTLTLSSTVTGIVEIGSSISPTLTLTGTKNDAGILSGLRIKKNGVNLSETIFTTIMYTDIASQFNHVDPNNPNTRSMMITYDNGVKILNTVTTSPSQLIYNGITNYAAGLPKLDSIGDSDTRTASVRSANAPQAADSNFSTSNITISGYYPYFYGKSNVEVSASDVVTIIGSGNNFTKVVNSGSGSLSMNFSADGQWIWFAIFEPFATKTTWYETALNNGSIGGVTDLFAAPSTLQVTSSNTYWTNIGFKIYVANKVTTLGTATIS